MSKFIDGLEAQWTGRVKPEIPRLVTSVLKMGDPCGMQEFTRLREYTIETAFIQNVTCDPKDLNRMLEIEKRRLARAMYGEFIDRLIMLERAIYGQELEDAHSILRDIMREVEQ